MEREIHLPLAPDPAEISPGGSLAAEMLEMAQNVRYRVEKSLDPELLKNFEKI